MIFISVCGRNSLEIKLKKEHWSKYFLNDVWRWKIFSRNIYSLMYWINGTISYNYIIIILGQKVATRLSVSGAPAVVRRTIAVHRHPQDDTLTHQEGRRRSLETKPTSGSAAAPGAVAAHRHTLLPETEEPAKQNPPTTNIITPGETLSVHLHNFIHSTLDFVLILC